MNEFTCSEHSVRKKKKAALENSPNTAWISGSNITQLLIGGSNITQLLIGGSYITLLLIGGSNGGARAGVSAVSVQTSFEFFLLYFSKIKTSRFFRLP